jgi:hypothetical protein
MRSRDNYNRKQQLVAIAKARALCRCVPKGNASLNQRPNMKVVEKGSKNREHPFVQRKTG